MKKEKDLVERLRSDIHKEEAFRDLVSLYKEQLYWHIRRIVRSHDDSDDILQNTFIKVHNHIKNFKGESKLYSWLYRIATNESITFLNKKAKRLKITDEELQRRSIENLKADIYFEGDDIQLKLQEAIASLPQKQQLVFNMRYFQEIKYRDMAEILQTSQGALKASYHIATNKIKDFINSDE